MKRMLGNNESAFDSARSQFWVVDAKVSNQISFSSSQNFAEQNPAHTHFISTNRIGLISCNWKLMNLVILCYKFGPETCYQEHFQGPYTREASSALTNEEMRHHKNVIEFINFAGTTKCSVAFLLVLVNI